MENIIKLLQKKIGVTKNQAEKLIELFRSVLGDSAEHVEDIRSKVTRKLEELEDETGEAADKTDDTLNGYIDKIRSIFGSSDDNDVKIKKK